MLSSLIEFAQLVAASIASIIALASVFALMVFEEQIRKIPFLGRFPYVGALFIAVAFFLGYVFAGPISYERGQRDGAETQRKATEKATKERQELSDSEVDQILDQSRDNITNVVTAANEALAEARSKIRELELKGSEELPPTIVNCEKSNEKVIVKQRSCPSAYSLPANSDLLQTIRRSRGQ